MSNTRISQSHISTHENTSHEDRNDFSIYVARYPCLSRGKRKSLSDGGFDGGTGTANKIAQLITRANHKRSKTGGAELHEMNRDHAPCALDGKLLKKGSSNNAFILEEAIRIE
jgi:hypothetical protein